MHKMLRTALIWLVMLAVPMQGLAAATMLACGPMHQRMGAQAGGTPGHDHGQVHVHDAAHEKAHAAGAQAHEHTTHHAQANGDGANEAPVLSAVGKFDQSAKLSCSACASCCSGAVMVSSTAVVTVSAASAAVFVATIGLDVSFITDGPSRPPRPFLA